MPNNRLAIARATLVHYDTANDLSLANLAYIRCKPDLNSCLDEDACYIARDAHVAVWREAEILDKVFSLVWSQEKAAKYRWFLVSKGLSPQDAEDIMQSVALYTFENFEGWHPWRAGFWTWVQWLGRSKLKDLRPRIRPPISIEENELDIPTHDIVETNTPARAVLEKLEERLRDGSVKSGRDAADIIRHALDMAEGGSFTGLSSRPFQQATGLSRGQIAYRMKKAGVKAIAIDLAEQLGFEV